MFSKGQIDTYRENYQRILELERKYLIPPHLWYLSVYYDCYEQYGEARFCYIFENYLASVSMLGTAFEIILQKHLKMEDMKAEFKNPDYLHFQLSLEKLIQLSLNNEVLTPELSSEIEFFRKYLRKSVVHAKISGNRFSYGSEMIKMDGEGANFRKYSFRASEGRLDMSKHEGAIYSIDLFLRTNMHLEEQFRPKFREISLENSILEIEEYLRNKKEYTLVQTIRDLNIKGDTIMDAFAIISNKDEFRYLFES